MENADDLDRSLMGNIRLPRARLRAPRAAGVAGVLFSVLLFTAFMLVRFPPMDLSDAETLEWFEDSTIRGMTIAGLYLVPFAGIAFLWFIAVIRDRIGRFEDRFFSTVFIGSGLLFIATLFTGVALIGGLAAGERFLDGASPPAADIIRSTRALSVTLIFVYGEKMAGVFVFVTNTIAFRTRVFSRWVAIIGYLVGLVLLVWIGFNYALVTIFPAWVTFLSIYILVTARHSGSLLGERDSSF